MRAAEALNRGEVVLLDTDTLPGLHALASLEDAASRLIELKGAPPERPFLLLFDGLPALEPYVKLSGRNRDLLEGAWPGPVTAVLEATSVAPRSWVSTQGTLAARIPSQSALRELLAFVGPLFSTSANRSGEAPCETLEQASKVFPDLKVFELTKHVDRRPSTLVDCRTDPAVVLREGAGLWPPAPR